MSRLPTDNPLRKELAEARARAGGRTFDQAPELFKDIESIKVRIWTDDRAQKRAREHGKAE